MAPSRNTLNQRVARARRKSYIASLESKLHHHEQQGIQATREVQIAAQKVIDENSRLKQENELLRRALNEVDGGGGGASSLVVSDQVVNKGGEKRRICQRCGYLTTELRKQCPKNRKPLLPDQHALATQSPLHTNASIECSEEQLLPPGNHHTLNPPTPIPILLPLPPPLGSSPSKGGNNALTSQAGPVNTLPSLSPALSASRSNSSSRSNSPDVDPSTSTSISPCKPPTALNTMPCTRAALIIAGMRGTHNPNDIYPDLGCRVTESCADVDCNVENLRVMEMMERV